MKLIWLSGTFLRYLWCNNTKFQDIHNFSILLASCFIIQVSNRVLAEPTCVKEKKPFEILHEQIVNAKQRKLDKRTNGFEHGWQLEEIIDARLHEKKQQFFVKWRQSEKTEFVDAVFMKENYPQAVIAFYQASIIWSR